MIHPNNWKVKEWPVVTVDKTNILTQLIKNNGGMVKISSSSSNSLLKLKLAGPFLPFCNPQSECWSIQFSSTQCWWCRLFTLSLKGLVETFQFQLTLLVIVSVLCLIIIPYSWTSVQEVYSSAFRAFTWHHSVLNSCVKNSTFCLEIIKKSSPLEQQQHGCEINTF